MSQIGELIRQIVRKEIDEMEIMVATVDSVQDDRTCTVTLVESETEISGVRLQADEEGSAGVYIKPAVGSAVMVIMAKVPFVAMTSDVELVEINGDQHGGLTITPTLKTELDKTHNLLSALINVINGTPITEAGNGAPSALQVAMKAAITGQSLGSYENIENESVKHG